MSAGVVLAALAAVVAPSAAVTPYPAAFFAVRQPGTALDMVKFLPGFIFDPGDQVRGFGGAAGNVLIDGARPASKDDGLDEVLKRIPASSVLRIDVIRGGAPGVDMQGKTVIANVVRRPGGGSTVVVAGSGTVLDDGRMTGAFRLEGSRRLGETTWEGSFLVGRGYDDVTGDGPRTQRTPAGALNLNAAETAVGVGTNYKATGAVETPVMGGKLKVNASLLLSPYDYLQTDRPADPAGILREDDRQRQDTAELGLRYDHALGSKASIEIFALQQFGESRYRADYSAPGDIETFTLNKETSESIARATVNIQVSPALSVQTGGEGDFNWLLDHTDYVVNDVPTAVPAANVRVTEARGEGFLTTTWKAARTVTLEAGLRLEASRIASTGDVVGSRAFLFPKPRLVLTWSPEGADQFRLRLEREVGQLDFDFFAAGAASLTNSPVHAGNPSLTPQQAWVYEIAYDRRFWGGAQFTAALRHYDLTDVIDRAPIYDPSGTYDAPGNIGSGTKEEAALTLTLPTDRLGLKNGTLTAQSTLRRSRVIDPTTGLARPISGLYPLYNEFHFTQGLPKWKATWGIDIFDQYKETYYRFNEIDTDKLKTWAILFAEYKPKPDLTFRFEFQNLGGRSYRHIREIYDGPRNTSPLDYIDIRDLSGNRGFYVRVRKTFG